MNESRDRGPDPTSPTPIKENRAMRRARESVERRLRRKGKTVDGAVVPFAHGDHLATGQQTKMR